MAFHFNRKLPIPKEIKAQYPLSAAAAARKAERDRQISAVIRGEDNRFLLIIGPCSADNEVSVMDYICRLVPVQEKVKDKILIIPRIYTNKPRTTGQGYKGMVHQPNPEGAPDLLGGLIAIRKLHLRCLEETGFGAADEMLYPENFWYLSDLLSYVAVGARSVEDQHHRMTASAFDVATGMKNPTSGDLTVMMNSVKAAQSRHSFIYRGWDVDTTGNELAHTILRGSVNKYGRTLPNYHYEDLQTLIGLYAESGLKNPACIVDTNHSNSGKKYLEQIRIAKEVLHSRRLSPDIRKLVKGLMIESYIEDGAQSIHENIYGKSITDPCLGWEKTERLIYEIAEEC